MTSESYRVRAEKLRRPLKERFERHYIPEPNSGCFLWCGATDSRGYGQLRDQGRNRVATHVALELAGRPLPAGLCALHRCDVPACVNADHLFHGTTKDNIGDAIAKGRHSPPPRRIGAANLSAKLTAADVLEIRASPLSLRAVGRRYGISCTHASAIRRRKVWAHV